MPQIRRTTLLSAVAFISLLSAPPVGAHAEPPSDDQLNAVIADYKSQAEEAIKALPDPKDAKSAAKARKDVTDRLLAKVVVASLTTRQIDALETAGLMGASSRKPEFIARLGELAEDHGVDGAIAASLRLHFLHGTPRSDQIAWLNKALTHPGLAAAYKEEKAEETLLALRGMPKDILDEIKDNVLGLAKVITPECHPGIIARCRGLIDASLALAGENMPAPEELRSAVAEAINGCESRVTAEQTEMKASLESLKAYVNGPYVKGTLLGSPAPDIRFDWCSVEPAPTSLSQIKDRVVVLLFWSTSDRTSVVAIPGINELAAHYKGHEVVIVGVTAYQGVFFSAKLDDNGQPIRVPCKGEPAKEQNLMSQYIGDKGILWPVVYSSEPLANPDYGVNWLPMMVIIDAKGIVRHRAIHASNKVVSLADKCEKIDALLKEAGHEPPPPPPAPAAPGSTTPPAPAGQTTATAPASAQQPAEPPAAPKP